MNPNVVWQTCRLSEIAPACSCEMPKSVETVWNLSLEDIQAGTGKILTKNYCKVSELGSTKCAFDCRHVLYSKLRPYLNKVALPDKPGVGTSELIPLQPNSNRLCREFLAFYLRSPIFKEFAILITRGANLPRVSMSDFWSHEIPLPPLDEQRRIVGRIKECLSRVEEIERLRQESRMARSHLLESLIEETFHISSGDEVALFDICSIASALVSPNAPQYQQLPHVGGANIEPATGAIRDLKTVAEEKVTSAKFIFDSRMVLYNKIRPYLKKVTKPEFSGLCSADMYPLLPQSGRISKDYLFYVLLSRSFTNYAINGSNRAGMPKVNRNHLFAYRFRLPPIETQQSICLRLDYAFKSVQRLREETSATDLQTSSLRESILRKAFAGEL
jgi:type I restriction enzyme S subunit